MPNGIAPQIIAAIQGNRAAVLAVASMAIWAVVRLLKSDTRIPIALPPRVRPWLSVALGLLAGVLERATTGVPWQRAVFDGLIAGQLPQLAHDVLVEWGRGGRDLPLPSILNGKPTAPRP